MEEDGTPAMLLRLVEAFYYSTLIRSRAAGQESPTFKVQSDLRQVDTMSPTLFNYAIDFVLERAHRSCYGVQVGKTLTSLI